MAAPELRGDLENLAPAPRRDLEIVVRTPDQIVVLEEMWIMIEAVREADILGAFFHREADALRQRAERLGSVAEIADMEIPVSLLAFHREPARVQRTVPRP